MSSNPDARRKLLRPTLDTRFHIDYSWWERADRDLAVYLKSHMCAEHQERFSEFDPDQKIDHVDPETGEVFRVNGVEHALISHCSKQPDYLTPQTSLVNAIFRVFLANGNEPLSPKQLEGKLNRPARMILRTLSGTRVYKGIRPYIEE